MATKNILFLISTYPGGGGVETVSNNIIEYLGRQHTIYTLSSARWPDATAPECIGGMYYFDLRGSIATNVELLNKIIAEHKIDCIINQGMYPDFSDFLFHPQRTKGPKVFSFLHGMPTYEVAEFKLLYTPKIWHKRIKSRIRMALGTNRRFNEYIERVVGAYVTACREGERVVLLCNGFINSFIEAYKTQEYADKITAIPNPLSVEFSQPCVVEWEAKKNQVLYVGRLSFEKRVEMILDAWARVQNKCDWELVIVGDGEEREKLEKIARDKGLKRVVWAGWQPSVRTYYEQAKVVMLTSKYEGFGMCLTEAQRFGVVPLSFNISRGVESVVANPKRMLVDQNNTTQMAARLLEFMGDDAELRELSRQSKLKAQEYMLDKVGLQWEALLEE